MVGLGCGERHALDPGAAAGNVLKRFADAPVCAIAQMRGDFSDGPLRIRECRFPCMQRAKHIHQNDLPIEVREMCVKKLRPRMSLVLLEARLQKPRYRRW